VVLTSKHRENRPERQVGTPRYRRIRSGTCYDRSCCPRPRPRRSSWLYTWSSSTRDAWRRKRKTNWAARCY